MTPDLDELPEEVRAALDEHEETSAARLEALGIALAAKRKEAVDARATSGIEAVWLAAEEAYLGIDDSNRGSFGAWAKPTNMTSPLTRGVPSHSKSEVQSSAFVRLTSRYVDAGAAKLGEILLPIGEKAFSFGSTPVPDLVAGKGDKTQAIHNGIPLTREARPNEIAPVAPGAAVAPQGGPLPAPQPANPPAAPGPVPGVPVTVADIAQEAIDLASAGAKKAEKRIHDWMIQSQFAAEMRKVIFDKSRIGVGVLRGPFPRKKVSRAVVKDASGAKVVKMIVKFPPSFCWRDPWNIYPDPACGENIRDGDYLFDYEEFSAKQLRALKGSPGYIDSAIDKVLVEGPSGGNTDFVLKPGEKPTRRHRFGVWFFYGTLKAEDLMAANEAAGVDGDAPSTPEVYGICTMVNDTVIRATINPLDSGEFPYHNVPWQRRAGHWAGVGVSEQLELPQRAINAATRAMFNNAGKSAGSIIVHDQTGIVPADGSSVITPDKLYYKAQDATSDDVRKAFAFFKVPNVTPQLMTIIEYCLRLAEEATSIPLVTQGQSGPTSPETFGATQLQNNNANQLLRSIGYAFDDHITEPVVRQAYEMLLLDDTVPDDEKGDWDIDAHGSMALVERAIQDQTVQLMGQWASQPAFGVDPKKWFAEFSRSKHLNPKNFQYSPEEQAKINANPPVAPAIQVAQIKSADAKAALSLEQQAMANAEHLDQIIAKAANDTKLAIAAMKKEVDELRVKRDTDRDTVYVQAETQRTSAEFTARDKELALRRELALLDYANKNSMKLEDVKTKLADTQMKLQTERELAMLAARAEGGDTSTGAKPPVQIPGKAPDGRAFSQV